ncbi:MAG TPA: hypothetical protein V6D50_02030 [Chroococcales cyanobacterium]
MIIFDFEKTSGTEIID